ncbi:MAG: phenylalanine--tRNA ligase subunit beta [Rickettsiales bacterium]|nr:phenylalanine--tRNA ligase subunit beta [Rickettsiales bacterium]
MKFTLNWLKDYLDTDASIEQIDETLTAIGLEVESIEAPAAELAPFTVAKIEEAEQHSDADRLQICKVNTGSEILQIVCGAPNARAGIKVALATEGAIIPNGGFKIKKSKIRGVESNGMLCSAQELNIGQDSDGIMELPEEATLGTPIADALQLDDVIIDIAITPNRGDCLGVYGIARDLAAAGLGTLKALDIKPSTGAAPKASVTIEDSGCAQFTYATIHDAQNGESPQWLQQRLKAIGLRPISKLVDVTNYISIDLCRPLHVYDLDKLQGDISVREGKAGETFHALNDKGITLQGGEIAITDDSGLIGLGGIIGGTSTSCDENTKNVMLEVAWFDPIRIATTGRKLQIESDARYRFERAVDPTFLEDGAQMALAMIQDLCGGTASAIATTGKPINWQHEIPFNAKKINARVGLDVSEAKQKEILESLGFTFNGANTTPPAWRPDVEGSADLSEEIARIVGYDQIPILALDKPAAAVNPRNAMRERVIATKQALADAGLRESIHWSFTSSKIAPLFGGAPAALKLLNPISSELDQMRPSLLPHLIEASGRNSARGFNQAKIFEVGFQFSALGEKGQQQVASGVFAPSFSTKGLRQHERASDVFDAKAAVETVINSAGFDASRLQLKAEAPSWYHPGKSGTFALGKQVIAHFGEIHPRALKALDIAEGTIGFEVFLSNIPFPKKKTSSRPALIVSEFQAVQRDFAFVVNENTAAGDILRAAQKADDKLVKKVELFDVYQGKGLAADEKSLAISVTLQAADRTLTDKEIEAVAAQVIANVEKNGAKLRA